MPKKQIPSLRFYLYCKSKSVPIIATVNWEKADVRLSTGISIPPTAWNPKKQRVKASAANAGIINAHLDNLQANFQARMLEIHTRFIPITLDTIKRTLEDVIQGRYGGSIAADIRRYISARQHEYAEGTVKIYEALHALIERYERHKGIVLSYPALTAETMRDFIAYMLEIERYRNSQIQKVVKRLKTFLRYAQQVGWGDSPALHTPIRIPIGERPERPYLRLEELERFRTAVLPSKLARARDMFVLQCYTGLRWSDVQRIHRGMYDAATNELVLVTRKTRKVVRVPLLRAALEILERYHWELPQWSNAYQNELIKEGLKIVGIDEPVTIVEYRGAQRIERVIPKHDAISTHAAKRTFVSVLLSRGVTLETVCRITGNTRATIEAYIQKDQTEVRTEMQRVLEQDAARLLVSHSLEVV